MKPLGNRYLFNARYVRKRATDKQRAAQAALAGKWEPVATAPGDTNGNLKTGMAYDRTKKRVVFINYRARDDVQHVSLYQVIPASLLLHNCLAMWSATSEVMPEYGGDGCKVTWQYTIRHKASGMLVTLADWKGGATIWTASAHSDVRLLTQQQREDLLNLLSHLLTNKVILPYGGTFSGSVA